MAEQIQTIHNGDTMKIFIGTITVITLIFIIVCLIQTHKEKHRLAMTVKKILLFGAGIVFINTMILFTSSEFVALIGYSVYFVLADWLLFYLFRFSIEYIGNRFSDHVNVPAMYLLLIADNISTLLNIIFGHLFGIRQAEMFGSSYHCLALTPYFFIHYAIIAMLLVFSLISLYYRAFTAPMFYRRKYLAVAIILTFLGGFNAVCLFLPYDFSVIGFVAEGACIYYCTFVFTPQRLLPTTLLSVSQHMSVAIYVMDADGNKLYSNDLADSLFSADDPITNKDGQTLKDWCHSQYRDTDEEFTRTQYFYRGEDELILKIQLQRMKDVRKQLQGGYFVIQDCTDEYTKIKKERYLATHDNLTGLFNKVFFCDKVQKYVKKKAPGDLLLICSDIKDFKMVNDFFGTAVGDHILINFAEMLKNKIDGVIVSGRLGNDLFAVLMHKENFDEQVFLRRSREAFSSCMNKSVAFPMINHLGVYEITDTTTPVSVMCDRARLAIASIKSDYNKRVAYYDNALRENIKREQELIADLGDALSEGQLKMYLQPQMSSDGTVLGAEALVRWHHPIKGQIMPSEFIPAFERNGLISEVDSYIWELACKQLRKWKDEGKDDIYISVNISPRDFYFLDIYRIFTEMVEKYEVDPEYLKLEITETAVVMDFKRQLELISRLRKNGFIVEMDDFGSGYSSLNMLKDIHVDVLKIDMAFLRKAEDEERSRKILQMIIGLSRQLDMPVITEGVETQEQVEYLSKMGCDMFQGYYFAKPMTVEEFEALYEEQKAKKAQQH